MDPNFSIFLCFVHSDGDEIRVPDVDPEAFMAMLRYIYSEVKCHKYLISSSSISNEFV